MHYPDGDDAKRGLASGLIDEAMATRIAADSARGVKPPQTTRLGGEILIRGGGGWTDWTLGCVALDDSDSDILRGTLSDGMRTRVLILPQTAAKQPLHRRLLLAAGRLPFQTEAWHVRGLVPSMLLLGCQAADPEGPSSSDRSTTSDTPVATTPVPTNSVVSPPAVPVALPAVDQLTRISMALRGLRPAPEELLAVVEDPAAIDAFVDEWLDSEDFGKTMRDMHAQQFKVRTDTIEALPSHGPLTGVKSWDIYSSTTEAPLKLVEHVVMTDLPYTEIVTLDYMFKDAIVADIYGLPYDEDGETWQVGKWVDGRPHAGILTSSEMWRRYRSAGANYHRQRANFVADVLLCEAFASRDIVLPGGLDLSDEDVVLDAVNHNPACVGCHQAMDPLAAFFWGFRDQIKARGVRNAYDNNCTMGIYSDEPLPEGGIQEDTCYPLRMYQPDKELMWADIGLRPPGYFGTPGERLDELGQLIAADRRFATCTTRRFWSWFAQEDVAVTDPGLTNELTEVLEASNFDAKALTKAIVTHPRFLTSHLEGDGEAPFEPVGTLLVRPEQFQTVMRQLTGFQWWAEPFEPTCEPECWQVVDLGNSDRFGFRAMAGGIDGMQVTRPSYRAIPTTPLVYHRTASEAAGYVVEQDFALPMTQRRLLALVEPSDTDEAIIREQLAELHLTISSELVATDGPEVDLSWALWSGALALHGDTHRAWALTLTALLQDARVVFY